MLKKMPDKVQGKVADGVLGADATAASKVTSATERNRLEELFAKTDDANMTDAEFREYAKGVLMGGKPK